MKLTAYGYGLFLTLATLSYLTFFVWGKKRFHPEYKPDWKENRRALFWSFLSVSGNAILMMPANYAIAFGYSRMYDDVGEYGWPYLILSCFMILAVTETLIYWIHRILHTSDFLYKYVHAPHHSFRVTTPWAGVAFNPLDSFVQALPHHLCVFLFPIHINVYITFITAITIWAVLIHDRLSFMPWKGVNYTGHHTVHHWYYNYNFGQFLTLWDRMGGTYKSPDEVRHEVPQWVLPPHQFQSVKQGLRRRLGLGSGPKAGSDLRSARES